MGVSEYCLHKLDNWSIVSSSSSMTWSLNNNVCFVVKMIIWQTFSNIGVNFFLQESTEWKKRNLCCDVCEFIIAARSCVRHILSDIKQGRRLKAGRAFHLDMFPHDTYPLASITTNLTSNPNPDIIRKFFCIHVRYYVVVNPSVCLSVVCNVRAPYPGNWNFRQCF